MLTNNRAVYRGKDRIRYWGRPSFGGVDVARGKCRQREQSEQNGGDSHIHSDVCSILRVLEGDLPLIDRPFGRFSRQRRSIFVGLLSCNNNQNTVGLSNEHTP